MRDRYNKELEQLSADLNDMGVMSADIAAMTLECLKNYDNSKKDEITAALDEITQFERAIESDCMRLIMRQQPIASDLRTIRSTMFIIYDMERIAIQCGEIAQMLAYVTAHPQPVDDCIFRLGTAAVQMVTEGIRACEEKNEANALAVISYDDTVDTLFEEAKKALIAAIQSGGSDAESCVDMLMIAKYYERIADHAESMAGWAYYSKTGDHIK